ncbi:uncharacterized protein LOC115003547 [Cottoperca gobio]|uniref:RAD51-associated protein 2 n=1 Tax=Cottoperca gobio TaxID=56716 RepID=A0A6J2P764_COTGO|nr:RAD51-associated protein 2 [Cottoperca gobio]XP_029281249.1 RAD51-associated protein 2 [Cottoperca gobio]
MPARISQEPAEGDNEASPFSVIDPAIGSETDREAEEKRFNSGSNAGVELFTSAKVCEMETPLPLYSDVRLSQEVSGPDQIGHFNHHSRTQQFKDEKEDLWQSYSDPPACSLPTDKTQNKTGNEGSCHWKSSPSISQCRPADPPSAEGVRQESHDTVGHQLKEQDQSGCFPLSPDHLKTQEVEYLQTNYEIARIDVKTEINEKEGMASFEEEIKTDEHGKSGISPDLEEKLLQQNKKPIEDTKLSTGDCISDWTEGNISTYGNTLAHIDDEIGNNLECLSDHSYNAVIMEWKMEETTEEKEREKEASVGEETDVHGNSEILGKSEDDHQRVSQQKRDMTEECISECREDNMCRSGHKLTFVNQHEQENKRSCFSDYQHRAEIFMLENKDDLSAFTFPPTSDAVVPSLHELLHSQHADRNPTALNGNDRFSPMPSALTFNDRVGFDTFEKIQLSLDDDGGLSNSRLLTSLAGQLLKTPEQQLYHSMPEAESNDHEEVPEEEEEESEEEMEIFECYTENMAKAFSSRDTSCNELPNCISAASADVIALGWPDQQPNCESSYNSYECFVDDFNAQSGSSTVPSKSDSLASDVNHSPKFQMKKQFDMVLKELKLYFEISLSDFASDSRASTPEQCSDKTEALEGDASNCKEEVERYRDTSSDDADEAGSLEMCGGDAVVSCTSGIGGGEQEVPLGSHLCQDTSMYTAENQKESRDMEQKRKMWSPSFGCQPFLEQLSHRQPEQHRRLEPLRTCTRPIRVGLSKRAKTKHLHRPHPYKC